jgi:hypothetical protein
MGFWSPGALAWRTLQDYLPDIRLGSWENGDPVLAVLGPGILFSRAARVESGYDT